MQKTNQTENSFELVCKRNQFCFKFWIICQFQIKICKINQWFFLKILNKIKEWLAFLLFDHIDQILQVLKMQNISKVQVKFCRWILVNQLYKNRNSNTFGLTISGFKPIINSNSNLQFIVIIPEQKQINELP